MGFLQEGGGGKQESTSSGSQFAELAIDDNITDALLGVGGGWGGCCGGGLGGGVEDKEKRRSLTPSLLCKFL